MFKRILTIFTLLLGLTLSDTGICSNPERDGDNNDNSNTRTTPFYAEVLDESQRALFESCFPNKPQTLKDFEESENSKQDIYITKRVALGFLIMASHQNSQDLYTKVVTCFEVLHKCNLLPNKKLSCSSADEKGESPSPSTMAFQYWDSFLKTSEDKDDAICVARSYNFAAIREPDSKKQYTLFASSARWFQRAFALLENEGVVEHNHFLCAAHSNRQAGLHAPQQKDQKGFLVEAVRLYDKALKVIGDNVEGQNLLDAAMAVNHVGRISTDTEEALASYFKAADLYIKAYMKPLKGQLMESTTLTIATICIMKAGHNVEELKKKRNYYTNALRLYRKKFEMYDSKIEAEELLITRNCALWLGNENINQRTLLFTEAAKYHKKMCLLSGDMDKRTLDDSLKSFINEKNRQIFFKLLYPEQNNKVTQTIGKLSSWLFEAIIDNFMLYLIILIS